MASVAGSDIDTQDGFAVITSDTRVDDAGSCLATTRRVTSVSVMIPARPPLLSVIIAASPRLLANNWVTANTVLSEWAITGAFGRSFDTGRSFLSGAADLATLAAAFAMSNELVLSLNAALIGALATTGADETF